MHVSRRIIRDNVFVNGGALQLTIPGQETCARCGAFQRIYHPLRCSELQKWGESVERQMELPADDNPNFPFVEASFA